MKNSIVQDKANLSPAKRLLLERRLRAELAPESGVRPALTPKARPEAIPLSFAQKRLWFLYKLEGASSAYNIRMAQRLEGRLNETALKAALHDVVARHESLRTIFPDTSGIPRQEILPAETLQLDWQLCEVEEAELHSRLDQAGAYGFHLTREIPLRVCLFRLAPERHVLLLLLHHIACDGGSLAPLWRDLAKAYEARERGGPPDWTPLPVQYADYALWQRELLGDEDDANSVIARQLAYWQQTLAGLPEELGVPRDRPRPATSSYRGESIGFRIEPDLHRRLLKLAHDAQASLYMVMQAGLAALLTRLGAGADIPLGSAIEGRTDTALHPLVGFFVNTLVLRTETSGNPGFGELLSRVREQNLAAYAHQDLPFERLVEVLNPTRSLNRHPLFQVMLILQNNEAAIPALPGLTVTPQEMGTHLVKFDLSLILTERPVSGDAAQGIDGVIRYAADLFERETAETMAKRLLRMLHAVAANPAQSIGDVDLPEPWERRQILHEWNDTRSRFFVESCVHELFEEQARRVPASVAVVCEGRELTYEELNRRANQLAHFLREMGTGPETRVALFLERTPEMVIGLLGVLKAGGAYVPIDSNSPVERVAWIVEDAQAAVVLTQEKLREAVVFPGARVIGLDSDWQRIAEKSEENPEKQVRPENLAYVIYTSGSTGMPKGVGIEHRHISNYVAAIRDRMDLSEGLSFGLVSTIAADLGNTVLFPSLACGGTLRVFSRDEAMDGDRFASVCREHPLDCLKITPSHFQSLLADGCDPRRVPRQRLIFGGETLSGHVLAAVRFLQPECRIFNHYGPTECSVGALSTDVTCCDGFSPDGVVPLGRPMSNMSVYILDAQRNPVPAGVPGEIFIGGHGVGRGYIGRCALTAQLFLPDPFSDEPGARMYKTGDLGRWLRNGAVEFLGRNDFQVKIRGFRIELGEIEAQLEKHDGIRDVVVLAREDAPGDKRLVAYYTCANSGDTEDEIAGADALRRHLTARLPDYMVPAAYVRMALLPLTANGKLDRGSLPAPEADAYAASEYEAPQGEVETKLAAIWAEVLKLDRVGRHDNFFGLGGHSLLAVTVVERIRRLGLEVDVRTLFVAPTLASLAATLGVAPLIQVPANRIPRDCQAITPEMLPLVALTTEEIGRIVEAVPGGAANVQDIYPLAPLQEGMLFHYLMGVDSDPYLRGILLSFSSRARLDSYIHALQSVIDRHDILRTGVVWEGLSEPVQVVWRKVILTAEEVELEAGTEDAAGRLYERFNPRRFRMDLRQAPLLRLYVAFDREKDRWLMLMLRHHLAGDHSTLDVMHEEIRLCLLGEKDRLPAPLPFRNLVAQARLGVSRQEHEAYFRKLLGDVGEPTAPFGLLDVRGAGSGIAEAQVKLDANLSRSIREQARRLGVSAASLCHVAWAQVLARVSGREDVVFGSVLFGRMQGGEGADRVMGLFINTLPVRIRLGENEARGTVLETHRQLADLLRHEHASLALAQRCSAVPAPAPLFTALLNYRHSSAAKQARTEERKRAWEGMQLYVEERTNYPFGLAVDDLGEGFELAAQAESAIGPMRMCEYTRMALDSLVQALAVSPTTPVGGLDILPAQEREQLLCGWNETKREFSGGRRLHELFEQQAEKTPEAVAVDCAGGQLSYRELNRRANQLAHYLRGLGVGPDERVAICVDRGLEMMVGLLAILKAGGAYVPLDPAYPAERLSYMLKDSVPRVLLTQEHLLPLFSGPESSLVVVDLAAKATPWRDQPEINPDRGSAGPASEHLAYVIYTSGSTGLPKGVMIPYSALENFLNSMLQDLEGGADDVWLAITTLSFDIAGLELYLPLIRGARLRIVDREVSMDGTRLLEELRHVTTLQATPATWRMLLEAGWQGTDGLRALCGGEALRADLAAGLLNKSGSVRNMYGPTETTIWSAMHRLKPGENCVPIGRPIANTRIRILDGQGRPAPAGVAGDIYIGGAGVARGYLNRSELTAERFRPDPFAEESGARIYKTGDLGRWLADGTIECLGRDDFQVKVRGFRIELGEIETRLAEYHAIREAVVVASEDANGDQRLAAYYTCTDTDDFDEDSVSAERLRAHLAARLPDYMVPAAYVRLASLPLTANGKLDRKSLPAPAGAAYATRGYEAPRGEIESKLASIWSEVLRLQRVGRHDDFFALGGHSLLVVRLMSRIRLELRVEVAIRDIFARPVLRELAGMVQSAAGELLPPIERVERREQMPLSFAQQRLWFLARIEGVSRAYHLTMGLELRGVLDRDALRRALDRIVARHEALRTTFVLTESGPVQRILVTADHGFRLPEHDLRGHEDPQAALQSLIETEADGGFDLERGPLIRGRLICQAEDRHALLITMHHIVFDAWSAGVLIDELNALYGAFVRGDEDPLAELRVQYADYAAWQRNWISDGLFRQQADYWQTTLADAPALLELPADRPRPAQQDYAGGFLDLALDEKLTIGLEVLGRRHGTTLFMTLLAGWAALLARLSGQRDIVIGTPVANRGRSEIEGLIGLFVNTLALRLDLSDGLTVGGLLQNVKACALAAQHHQDIPFEQVVELARPERSLAHSPLFQVMFVWQNPSHGRLALPGLTAARLQAAPHVVTKFDLTLLLQRADKKIIGGLEYASALFEPATIERYAGYLRRLLEGMVANDAQEVHRLSLLDDRERQQALYEWNATAAEYPAGQCVHELFEAQVRRIPQATALACEGVEVTYQELNRRANRLAHYLRGLGVKPDTRVAVCAESAPETIIGLLGILKAGGTYVPLDPGYPVERLRYMLKDTSPAVVLTQGDVDRHFSEIREGLPVLDMGSEVLPWSEQPETDLEPEEVGLTSRHAAYVIYTSGSTGRPKGVMIEHRSVINLAFAQRELFGAAEHDSILQFFSFSFDVSMFVIVMTLSVGARLVLARRNQLLPGPGLVRLLREERITLAVLPPVVLSHLPEAELPDLRQVILGGEAWSEELLDKWGQGRRFFNSYGPTETTVQATATEYRRGDGKPSIGRPIRNVRIFLLDAAGHPVPTGIAGELYIGGDGVGRGYIDSALTAERFVPDPFSGNPGGRLYRTGDWARRLADGRIDLLGRKDDQVKIRGYRVELGEIESMLGEHPLVQQGVVVMAGEKQRGDQRLVAYLTAAEGQNPEVRELRVYLKEKLPEYMVPSQFVILKTFPLTESGKVNRRELPPPEDDGYAEREYEAPQGEIEIKLAEIWAQVLKLQRVGRHDNFFALGGHSLLAVTVIERIRRSGFGVDVRMLFAAPTLATLAATMDSATPAIQVPANGIPLDCHAIVPEMLPLVRLSAEEIEGIVELVPGGAGNVQDIYPLAPLQAGILFHYLMGGDGDPYLASILYSFDSRARLEGYIRALKAVIARHDILRTGVVWEGLSEPVQVVWRKAVLPVEEVELSSEAGDAAGQLYARFNPRTFRLDVRQAPLLRLYVAWDREKAQWLMLMLRHHLAGDHSTQDVMNSEIQAYLLGEEDRLPPPLSFRNLVAQARLGVSERDHEAYFRKLLGAVTEPTAPFGLLDVRGDGSGIEEARVKLDADMARKIRGQARRLGVSAASLCHVAWAQVLGKVSGREDVVFGSVLFGRMQGGEGADRVMGLFINTLPVRIRLGEEEARSTVLETHRQLADLLRHEHASLALAQRCSAVPAPAPLFTALLNYRHSGAAKQARTEAQSRAWEGMRTLHGEERTNYPLILSVDDMGDGFDLTAQAEASIGPLRVCEYVRTALESLVQTLEISPSTPVRGLSVLPASERRQLLYEWNETKKEYSGGRCVHELFEEQAERIGEAVAVVCNGDEISYRELNRRANRLAHYLRGLGVRPDARVAICVERGLEMIIGILGVLKAGGAYVPLDPAYPPERLSYMLADCAPVVLITQGQSLDALAGLGPALPVVNLAEEIPGLQHQPETNPDAETTGLAPGHVAYLIYTSGSTGKAKGVMVRHANVARLFSATHDWFHFDRNDVWTLFHSYAFDFSVWEIWGALVYGGKLVIVPQATTRSPREFYNLLCAEGVTILNQTPSAFRHLIAAQEEVQADHCLRRVIFGGEALEVPMLRPWYERERNRKTRLINMYGITETTVHVTYRSLEPADTTISGPSPIGCRIPDLKIYILDAHREPAPIGVAGEMYVGGAGVARGYLNRPELTKERFVADPFSGDPEARMYRTGDVGRFRPDGSIEFLGRNDLQVKIRGFRIELGEIESRLAEYPGLRDAVVLAREDAPGDRRLVAYYTSSTPEGSIGAEELRTHLSARLPEYMVPAAYVWLRDLPLTTNGKLDRKALPAPEGDAYAMREYEEPRGEIETKLAEIWAEILKLERVGRHDNFFSLGGHSLLAVTVIERTRRIGLEVDVRTLFASPTLAALAAAIDPGAPTIQVPDNRIPFACTTITPEMLPLVNLTAEEIGRIVDAVRGGAANVQDIYPLAPLQEGILFHHLMGHDGDPYLLGILYSFDSRARLDSYIRALQAVIDRHDILRTGVVWEGLPEPVQVVWRKAILPVEEVVLEPGPGDAAARLYARFNPRLFRLDVRQAPLLRLYFTWDGENDRWLMMMLRHHLAGDHSTLEVIQSEIRAYLLGDADRLPPPLPFRNLVAQARLGVSQQEHEAYFRKLLEDVTEPTAPFGLMDVRGDGSGIREARVKVDEDLARRIRERARRLGVSAASLCHVAWAQVLARVSGQDDVVFGSVLFGRMQGGEGADRVMGLFINTLPVRLRLGEDGARKCVLGAHKQLADLLRHEHASLALAQRCSAVPAPAPLFTALLNYRHNAGAGQVRSEDRKRAWEGIRGLHVEERTNYPFTLSVDDLREGFELTAQVRASIGPLRICEFMRTALASLVQALEAAPATPVRRLDVLPAAEREQLLYEWNQTKQEFPGGRCIHELFEEQAESAPGAPAVVFEGRILSYGELNRRANRLAHYLRELGVRPDTRVAICVERGPEMIVGVFAVLKAGGAYVPLDPAYPAERLRYMLEDCAPVALLTQASLRGMFAGLNPDVSVLDLEAEASAWSCQTEANLDPSGIGLTSGHLAYVIYTSGSTGKPKGVMVRHQGLCNLALAQARYLAVEAESRVLLFASFSFDASVSEIIMALCSGAALYVLPQKQLLIGDTLIEAAAHHAITHATLSPAALAGSEPPKPECIGILVVAGEALPESSAKRWGRGRRLINAYGPTETTICATIHLIGAEETGNPPIGKPITNMRVFILDSEGEPAPVGVAGEIHIGGAGVARGYLNRAALTAEKFLPDPFGSEAGARMYRTGDLGRWQADGEIEFLGRNDFQAKIRGFRIEPGEIESRLAECPGIKTAVVIVREDTAGDKRLVAYYTTAEAETVIGAGELRAHLSASLPEYMVPAAYVQLSTFPLTANGKLDRRALPVPEADAYAMREYEEPLGEVETMLAAAWAEMLKLDRVGRHDNFFELGGHSLLAVRVISRLRYTLSLELALVDFFARPVLSEFAEHILDLQLQQFDSEEMASVLSLMHSRQKGVSEPI